MSIKSYKELSLEEAYTKAETYAARAERSLGDIMRKLYEWHVDKSYHEQIVAELRRGRYLDDERYALSFARDKARFSGWGRQRIRQELYQRKVASEAIDAALAEVFAEYDERELVAKALQSKLRQLKDSDPVHKRYQQLLRFGAYRGFPYESVRAVAQQLLRGEELDED